MCTILYSYCRYSSLVVVVVLILVVVVVVVVVVVGVGVIYCLIIDPLSDTPTLLDFLENVATRIPAKWRKFGIALMVPSRSLDAFEQQQHGDQIQCYEEIFHVCQNRPEPLQWEDILRALRTRLMNETLLAEELEQRLSSAQQ